jgi:hypothetical protein
MVVLDHPDVLLLPLEYIGKDGGKPFVELPPAKVGAVAERRYVVIGASSGSMAEIVSGVAKGTAVQKPQYVGPKRKGFMDGGGD